MEEKKVIVYSTPTCPFCHKAKEFLAAHNVPFEDVDVASDQARAKEMVEKSGQLGVPVIDVAGVIIIGFDEAALQKELHLQ
ncbi:MAG: glutathione S-transferase N-terminal domain-containing protein [Candidatus Woesearchaeota archaeon]|nr:MAG: glutathione S-transferase N-terminal domain-containing protein [Candidatus Woesearchaeota archaeon]